MQKHKIETAWLAVKTCPTWADNPQHTHRGTWPQIVEAAKLLAQSHQKEVRVSTSAGFNNQGHYFWPE